MGKVHRAVMSRIAGPVQPVFLDTPAGFELNADQISARAVQYFERHLNLDLDIASFKTVAAATPAGLERALSGIRRANYIFAGPGSPTYAIRNWQGTAILKAMAQRLATGAHLTFASAAAIAIGRYALPVYEIYKVGEDPHWADGLDLLGPYSLELAIVPHWNNAEGSTHDTRYCFVGEPRMRFLEQRLPNSAVILGIDEYTACTIDLGGGEGLVMGAGQVTIRRGGQDDRIYPAGTSFALDELKGACPPGGSQASAAATSGGGATGWIDWHEFLESGGESADEYAGEDEVVGETESVESFIDLAVQMRTRLRSDKQWELADEIRDRLADLGVILEDGPIGTTWRRKGA
jgi:hypothetical protein